MQNRSFPATDSTPSFIARRAVSRPARGVWAAPLSVLSLSALTLLAPAGLRAQTSGQSYAIPSSRPNIIRNRTMAVPTTPREIAKAQRDQQRDREKAQRALAKSRKGRGDDEGTEAAPMISRRVLLLLPLRLGAGWSANPVFTRGLLPRASQALKDSLRGTEKFSIVEVHRHNPVLLRGVSDGMFTQEELDTLLREPTVENARLILSKLTFDQQPKLGFLDPPQIAEFVLERFPAGRGPNEPSVQVIGRLYDPGAPEATKTSAIITALRGVDMRVSDLTLASTALAFARIATEFARPLIEAEAPFLPTAGMSVTSGNGASPAPENPDGGQPDGVAPGDLPPAPTQPAEPVPPQQPLPQRAPPPAPPTPR